jgi:two-component system sensor histidine kinase/response regulator
MSNSTQLTPEMLVPRLGNYLIEKGLITHDQLSTALAYQANKNKSGEKQPLLGQILIELNMLDRPALDQAITEVIIQLRSALQESNRQLDKRVQERTAELQMALNKLTEANQLKSNFVANISHELRTPLTHLKGYLELLSSNSFGQLNAEQTSAVEIMIKSADRLENLIEDLIRFSLAEKGQFTLHIDTFDISKVIEFASKSSSLKAAEKNITLICNIPSQNLWVKADKEKITWVILHLLENGIKFTPQNGKVILDTIIDNNIVTIRINDTGIGIPEDKLDIIFEPFRQLDGSATRKYGGAGLGLSLVKQIIEAHGSMVIVKSSPSKGSSFEFSLALEKRIS